MSNVFDLKRFGNYFTYDCRRAWKQFGLNLILIALVPVIVFIVQQLYSLVISGHMTGLESGVRFGYLFFGGAIVAMVAPAIIYGNLTEKKSGSSWLMIPASSFEKWLSMVLVLSVVLLVTFCIVFFAGDGLLSLLFPNLYGSWSANNISSLYSKYLEALNSNELPITFNFPALLFTSWMELVLIFALGALYFKKTKVARTILVLIGLGFLIGILATLIMVNGGKEIIENFFKGLDALEDPRKAITWVNSMMNLRVLIINGGLLAWLFFRIKSLKH